MAKWLCESVGPSGYVVATDLDIKFLMPLEGPNLEVRQHNIVSDPLEEAFFDFVFCRNILIHISTRDMVLKRLVAALKSGGWLLVEEADYTSFAPVSEFAAEFFVEMAHWCIQDTDAIGMDFRYGRRLGSRLRAEGLVNVEMDGIVSEWGGDSPRTFFHVLGTQRFRDLLIKANTEKSKIEKIDRYLDLIQEKDFRALSPTMFSARGRKPR